MENTVIVGERIQKNFASRELLSVNVNSQSR